MAGQLEKGGDDAEEDTAQASKRRRRRGSRVKPLEELQEDWQWLSELKADDKPWLYFALHKAYHARECQSLSSTRQNAHAPPCIPTRRDLCANILY